MSGGSEHLPAGVMDIHTGLYILGGRKGFQHSESTLVVPGSCRDVWSRLLADMRYSRYVESAAYLDYRPVERRMHHSADRELVLYSIQCCQSDAYRQLGYVFFRTDFDDFKLIKKSKGWPYKDSVP